MPKGLTDRQRRFVDAYAITRRGAAAAIAAGYGAKWASSAASRLLKQPEVLAALQRRISPKATVPPAPLEPLQYLLRVMNDPEARVAARMQAAIAAAPFVHFKAAAGGKRARQQEAAAVAGSTGRYKPSRPPAKVVPIRGSHDNS